MSNQTISIPTTLIHDTPNNAELGEKVRKIYNETIKEGHSIFPDNVEYTDEYFKPNYVNPYKSYKK